MFVNMASKSWVSIRLSPAAMVRNCTTDPSRSLRASADWGGPTSDARRAPPQMGCECARLQAQEGLNCAWRRRRRPNPSCFTSSG